MCAGKNWKEIKQDSITVTWDRRDTFERTISCASSIRVCVKLWNTNYFSQCKRILTSSGEFNQVNIWTTRTWATYMKNLADIYALPIGMKYSLRFHVKWTRHFLRWPCPCMMTSRGFHTYERMVKAVHSFAIYDEIFIEWVIKYPL